MSDTNFYQQALAEFREKNPRMSRATDMTPALLSSVLRRAQELKDEAKSNRTEILGKVSQWIGEEEMERSRR